MSMIFIDYIICSPFLKNCFFVQQEFLQEFLPIRNSSVQQFFLYLDIPFHVTANQIIQLMFAYCILKSKTIYFMSEVSSVVDASSLLFYLKRLLKVLAVDFFSLNTSVVLLSKVALFPSKKVRPVGVVWYPLLQFRFFISLKYWSKL